MSKALESAIAEYQLYNRMVEEYMNQLNAVNNMITEVEATIKSLEELKNLGGNIELLTPLGSGAFIRTTIQIVDRVIINIGAGVYTEKSIEESLEILRKRAESLRETSRSIQENISKLLPKISQLENRIAKLSRQRQSE